MPAVWYYLDGEKKQGPVSGKELRELTTSKNILPSTPVQRVHNDQKTPWTRAGAIKELFPDDVTSQLGPKICDACGLKLQNESCPICNLVEPPPIQREEVGQSLSKTIPQEANWQFASIVFFAVLLVLLTTIAWQQHQILNALSTLGSSSNSKRTPMPVQITNSSIPVEVENSRLPVEIERSCEIDVNVVKNRFDPIPVQLENTEPIEVWLKGHSVRGNPILVEID